MPDAANGLWDRRYPIIAAATTALIAVHFLMRFGFSSAAANVPLWIAVFAGGGVLVAELLLKLLQREFGSDLLAGISIATAAILGEPLAGAMVVLMLSGGATLEAFAVGRASSVLDALARRMPSKAHRKTADGLADVALEQIAVGDEIVVLPHEICPVDGAVVDGRGSMDEAYLTGEPYRVSKSIGSEVMSGAVNGDAALTIRSTRLPVDSRYARIMQVMQQSQQNRPQLRRLGDQLGAVYTPIAVAIAGAAWLASGDPVRFLAVLVIATPCPLLIAIPVAIMGAISLSARRSIVIRDPAILERIGRCRTMIFDKTGTLTYGRPALVEEHAAPAFDSGEVLKLAASLELYSRHPLATPIVDAAKSRKLELLSADRVEELPGKGLVGLIGGKSVRVTNTKTLLAERTESRSELPASAGGLECVILIDDVYAATYRFRDEPRVEGKDFIGHLADRHRVDRVMMVSGDRKSEVEYLAGKVGIREIHAGKSPEEKVEIVRAATREHDTIYVGDGVNDAPAMVAATVGLAMGQRSEVTTEAAGAVLMDEMLGRVDELMHIGMRMRSIALQSAVGGMVLSIGGMAFAAFGLLPPVAGAVAQEVIDVVAVLNALRTGLPPERLTDFDE